MNAKFLADQAVRTNARAGEYVSTAILHRLWRAHVAEWLAQQDEGHLAAAAITAVKALEILAKYEA